MSYDAQLKQYFDIFDISEDSGRKTTKEIEVRQRQEINEHLNEQAE